MIWTGRFTIRRPLTAIHWKLKSEKRNEKYFFNTKKIVCIFFFRIYSIIRNVHCWLVNLVTNTTCAIENHFCTHCNQFDNLLDLNLSRSCHQCFSSSHYLALSFFLFMKRSEIYACRQKVSIKITRFFCSLVETTPFLPKAPVFFMLEKSMFAMKSLKCVYPI